MAIRMSPKRRADLLKDILSAEYDVVGLGQKHGMSAEEMSRWIGDEENRRMLSGLCVMADLQTQLLLSRYRLVAAGRLIKLATGEEGGDLVRKSCVDLLKLDLKRAEGIGVLVPDEGSEVGDEQEEGKGGGIDFMAGLSSLREKLYQK